MIADSHHHFWDPNQAEYPWMTGEYEQLKRPFGPSELAPLLEAAGVAKTVVVQARQDLSETRSLLSMAAEYAWLAGVVGWVDLTDPDLASTLAEIRSGPGGGALVGVRHVVHDEPDAHWLMRDDVIAGLKVVADAGLAYDLLVRSRELPAATETARLVPNLTFVIDHMAKPAISKREFEPWAERLGAIASLPNVRCKISGLVTEADWKSWRRSDFERYVSMTVELFGPERIMWGSDWPVCTVAASYDQVLAMSRDLLEEIVGNDLAHVLGGCAMETYGIES
ncbi:MAG: amidohydrolase family protein [Acidimicrobiia bacterium]